LNTDGLNILIQKIKKNGIFKNLEIVFINLKKNLKVVFYMNGFNSKKY